MVAQTDLKQALLEDRTLSLVQFKTDWRGACQIVGMICEDLAKSYNGVVNFYTVNFEKETGLVNEFGITEPPTILFYKSGQLIDHTKGMISKNLLIAKIENALSN